MDYWFPFTPTKWKRETIDLTPAEDGVYLRLIMYYMETKLRLPESENSLARIAGISLSDFEPIWKVIHRFFHRSDDGRFSHDFCDKILTDQNKRSHKNKKRAKTAAHARWSKGLEKQGQIAMSIPEALHDAQHKNATRQDMTGQDRKGKGKESLPIQIPPEIKPPLPPEPISRPRGSGAMSLGEILGGGAASGNGFSLRGWLDRNPSEETEILRELWSVAPGKDRQWLIREYDATAGKRTGIPKHPRVAFLGWARKFYGNEK